MNAKVAIIYLCHNDLCYVPEVVESWENLNYPKDDLSFVIIPNGATDGVQDFIKDKVLPRSGVDLPNVMMIDDGVNRGFAGGNNLGIEWAIANDFDYVFLNNGDLKLDKNTISELVKTMEGDENIGSAQSLILLWNNTDIVNTTGGVIHIAGFGYARDNGKKLSEINVSDKEEIMYASGASVMYKISALKKIGMLEEGFFMYHEDLELGLRLRFAGYKNILVKKSIAYHDYNFSRNPKKFMWMELYRHDVILGYMKYKTLFVLLPLLIAIEIGVWLMALKGGWFLAKIKSCLSFWSFKNLKLIFKLRRRAQDLRIISDKNWLKMVSGRIEDQGQESKFMSVINLIIDFIWQNIRKIIIW